MSLKSIFSLIRVPAAILVDRFRWYRIASRLDGLYSAHNIRDRHLVPMEGASVTKISARSPWSPDPHVLDVYGSDWDGSVLREHDGYLEIDKRCPTRATRTIFYRDSDEVTTQRVEIVGNGGKLFIFPEQAGYGHHALLRAGILGIH